MCHGAIWKGWWLLRQEGLDVRLLSGHARSLEVEEKGLEFDLHQGQGWEEGQGPVVLGPGHWRHL